MNEKSFRFNLKGITGKLILFFIVIIVGVIFLSTYLIVMSSDTANRTSNLESVRIPITSTINKLNEDVGLMVSSLEGAAIRKDSLGNLNGLNNRLSSDLSNLEGSRKYFSLGTQPLVDSVVNVVQKLRNTSSDLNRWLTANYVNASSDSATLATLPMREAEELLPLNRRLQAIHKRLTANSHLLVKDNESVIRSDIERIKSRSNVTAMISITGGLMVILIVIIAGVLFIKSFRKSLSVPTEILSKLVKGEASEFSKPTEDELGVIIDAANVLSSNLQLASTFAVRIGEGDVNFSFNPVSEQDLLGNSLVQMRDKLKSINAADSKRNWVSEGLAQFADFLRKSDDYTILSNTIVSELVKYTKSTQGGMYIIQEQGENKFLELTACYAFERKKYIEKRIELGEGLVGQCFLEARTILLKEVPNDYVTITSGLGGANPNALLLVPLKINDEIEGVIELASFKVYEDHEIEFIERLGEIVASTISNAKINARTKVLLEESQQQSEEMRAQEEEMRQNMEEMQATQEQMQRQTEEMRKIQETLEVEKGMFKVLMEFLPDRITFKDRQSIVLRINTAKAVRFKIEPEEMIGKSDYDYFAKDHADKAFAEEQQLIQSGIPLMNIEERAALTNGEIAWASTSRIPFKNERKETIGMFIITKDISKLKIAESSIRDRERIIEQLLENIPVFRYQVDRDGLLKHVWAAKPLVGFEPTQFEFRNVKECLPEVYDLLDQSDLGDMDLVGKGIVEINGEKEIFMHYLFKDSSFDNVYLGFAIKQ